MIRVILFGAGGRMGRLVAAELAEQGDMTLVAGVEIQGHPDIASTTSGAPVYTDGDELPEADVWVDSSLAGPALSHARKAADTGMPLVIAATGFSHEEESELEQLAGQCPILLAPNLSVGVGVLHHLAGDAARLLGDDFEPGVFELHHSAKRDSPSGTALRLAEQIAQEGTQPGIASLRAGGAVGEHRVHFVGPDEELVLVHRAWSRRAFSRGAPGAVRFIVGRKPGLYTLRDLFNPD